MVKIRDKKTKEAFIQFLQDPKNKDLRFWQAIYSFIDANYIYTSKVEVLSPQVKDMFYVESDEEVRI